MVPPSAELHLALKHCYAPLAFLTIPLFAAYRTYTKMYTLMILSGCVI